MGQIGSLNGRQLISDLGDTGGCLASQGQCMTADGLIIWRHEDLDTVCQYEFKGNFEAQITSGGHIVVEALQGAFTVNTSIPKPNCPTFPPQAQMTDQSIAIYTRDAQYVLRLTSLDNSICRVTLHLSSLIIA